MRRNSKGQFVKGSGKGKRKGASKSKGKRKSKSTSASGLSARVARLEAHDKVQDQNIHAVGRAALAAVNAHRLKGGMAPMRSIPGYRSPLSLEGGMGPSAVLASGSKKRKGKGKKRKS